jgi:hypothetical protein
LLAIFNGSVCSDRLPVGNDGLASAQWLRSAPQAANAQHAVMNDGHA